MLLKDLKAFYATDARRHLPWRPPSLKLRKDKADVYRVLVSEMMLQQTPVDRVVPYFNRFIKKFPTAKQLARASLSEVLKEWQGLGYNRRGKYLWEAAKIISTKGWGGRLPGVGPYTAAAVEAFAHNKPTVFVETNIRTVFFHHQKEFVIRHKKISDAQLLPLVAQTLKKSKMEPRDFYAALMDYGSHLKRQGVRLNARSKHYAKQSTFEGSTRQLRGAILRELLQAPASLVQLKKKIPRKGAGDIERELVRLEREGLVKRSLDRFRVE